MNEELLLSRRVAFSEFEIEKYLHLTKKGEYREQEKYLQFTRSTHYATYSDKPF
jgi:predicted DNA-binding transcriptional regulator AlpA